MTSSISANDLPTLVTSCDSVADVPCDRDEIFPFRETEAGMPYPSFPSLCDSSPNLFPGSAKPLSPPLRLRTAWKRKENIANPRPGKPAAKRAHSRRTASPKPGNVRGLLPGPNGLPNPTVITPAPSYWWNPQPLALRPTSARSVVMHHSGANPRAKSRRSVEGCEERPTDNATMKGERRYAGWSRLPQWLGTALIAFGLLIAVGAIGTNYVVDLRTRNANTTFQASLTQFGPTPTPLSARATLIAARGSAGAGNTGIGPTGETNSAPPRPSQATQLSTPGGIGQGGQNALRGPAPIVSGGQSTPRSSGRNITPPPIVAVQPVPPLTTPQPALSSSMDSEPVAVPSVELAPTPTLEMPPPQPIPTHITIPSLAVDANIVDVGITPMQIDGQDVYIWDVAAYAVGHHFNSANPGEGENVVLSGHDDWQGEVFRDLYKLKKGDGIMVRAGDKTWSYHVDTLLLLQEVGVPLEQRLDNALYIGTTGDERLTLITCWPYGVDDYRLVLIAKPDWCTQC